MGRRVPCGFEAGVGVAEANEGDGEAVGVGGAERAGDGIGDEVAKATALVDAEDGGVAVEEAVSFRLPFGNV